MDERRNDPEHRNRRCRERVPNRKGKVAEQVMDAARVPHPVGMEDQVRVVCMRELAACIGFELMDELLTRVDPGIRRDPNAAIQTPRLLLFRHLDGGSQHCMSQAHMGIGPALLGIRTSKGHVLRHFAQQTWIDWCAIKVDNANNAAHDPLAYLLFLRVNR